MGDGAEKTCPLCAEEMDLTDQQLKPCRCGYEICVWCWHHIMEMAEKDDTEGRCPACRTPYDKEKIVGMAAKCERLVAEINMERKKSRKVKPNSSDGRKQLSSVRVIQRNLVYIVGLPLNLADEDILQRREYFGQYGKVLKVSMSRTATGVIQQFPNNTCSVYITYSKQEEAIRCIQSVHGFVLDGRSLKACFGTTKYCHAWLRNVPCINPDCLYLHEIGSQEDCFTKDEIISAFSRSRVQQISGATNKVLQCSGSTLPSPVDDYCYESSVSVAKPIVKNASNNTSAVRGSPPNGSSGTSVALPPAASWGMHAANQPQATSSTWSNGPTKAKPETVGSTLAFSSAAASTTQVSTLHGDVGKKSSWNEESQPLNGKIKPDSSKLVNQLVGVDFQANVPEKPAINDETAAVILNNQSSSSPASEYSDWGTVVPNVTNSNDHAGLSSGPEKSDASTNGKIQTLCSDILSLRVEGSIGNEPSVVVRTSSFSDEHMLKTHESRGVQSSKPFASPATEKSAVSANEVFVAREQFDWRIDPQTRAVTNTISEAEEDVISFDNQRLKDPEVVSRATYLPNSANSVHVSSQPRSQSLQHNKLFGAVCSNSHPIFVDDRIGDCLLQQESGNSVMSNGYHEKLISSSTGSDRKIQRPFLLPNNGEDKEMGRLQCDAGGNAVLDIGESSIISNILSLDLDAWDDSLTSPQNLSKLLGETNEPPSSLKMSSSQKVQNNNQSRFSFARQEETREQSFDVDPSFSVFGRLQQNWSFGQDFAEKRNSYLGKLGSDNGFFSSHFEESGAFTRGHSVFSSNKPTVSRAQISAAPGFSVPSKAPPPGFSSHERMDQTFDTISRNHFFGSSSLLRNSYQGLPSKNLSSTGDIEFMDPAILAVGKGRLHGGGLNGSGLDMRSNLPQQLSAIENEARFQLLIERSLSPHQNQGYIDIGDRFSSLNDSYGITSRLVDQSQVSSLSPLAQLSFQQSQNGLMSNEHSDGWNEVQVGNSLRMAELLRNERLGFNKFYTAGYEDSKFRMPNSGNVYKRTFEM